MILMMSDLLIVLTQTKLCFTFYKSQCTPVCFQNQRLHLHCSAGFVSRNCYWNWCLSHSGFVSPGVTLQAPELGTLPAVSSVAVACSRQPGYGRENLLPVQPEPHDRNKQAAVTSAYRHHFISQLLLVTSRWLA
jgi:hypothetical protein